MQGIRAQQIFGFRRVLGFRVWILGLAVGCLGSDGLVRCSLEVRQELQ